MNAMNALLEFPIVAGSVVLLDQLLVKGFSLKRETTFRLGKVARPIREKDTPLSYKAIEGYEFSDLLKECIDHLEDVLDVKNKTYFHKNISNLKIKKLPDKIKDEAACYSPYRNRMELGNFKCKGDLSCELLHTASTTKNFGLVFTGFCQHKHFNEFGNGLNEGYTQVLNNRYFTNENDNSHYIEQVFAKCIEAMVGQDEMERYYFMGELSFLLEDLEDYMKREDAEALIVSLDIIEKYLRKKNKTKRQERLVKKALVTATKTTKKGLEMKVLKSGYDPSEINAYYNRVNKITEIIERYGVSEDDLTKDDLVKLPETNFMQIANEMKKRKVRV